MGRPLRLPGLYCWVAGVHRLVLQLQASPAMPQRLHCWAPEPRTCCLAGLTRWPAPAQFKGVFHPLWVTGGDANEKNIPRSGSSHLGTT